MNVAIIVIATGAYTKFFKKLNESINRYFLPRHNKTVILFTDKPDGWPANVNVQKALHLPWPLPSLLRFDRFTELDLSPYDLVYYLDADQEIVATIEDNEVVPVRGQLVAVTHPANYMKSELFETNPASAAYCNPRLLGTYYHANFFGGHREDFIAMTKDCANSIAKDFSNLFIAKWFDESHLNRYLAQHPPKVLPSTYGFPSYHTEDQPDKKIVHFAKDQDSLRAYKTATSTSATRGVVLLAAGNECYGRYAVNLAASIVQADPEAKVTLFASENIRNALTKVERTYFDRVIDIPKETLYVDGTPFYNRFKLFLPHISPYDESIYLDVDSLWVSKMGISQLFDFMKVHKAQLGGQCEAVVPVAPGAVIFKGIKDLKPLEAFHPPLEFINKNFYQIHGQCVYCTKTPVVTQVFDTALRIFDAMLHNKLTCTMYWVWHGQPIEELALTLATGMVQISIPEAVCKLAPVSVQSDELKEIDPFSSKRFLISINGYNTYDEARRAGGYCMGEENTTLYINHYNKRIAELQASGFQVSPYVPKIVEL